MTKENYVALLGMWVLFFCCVISYAQSDEFKIRDDIAPVDDWCIAINYTNGCSVPLPSFPFTKTFDPACTIHDVCYRCAAKYGWTQEACDNTLHDNLRRICRTENAEAKRRDRRGIFDIVRKLKEQWDRLMQGWREAKKHLTSEEEINRLWNGVLKSFELLTSWYMTSWKTYLDECLALTDLYHVTVKTFGMYRMYPHPKSYCDEECSFKLGHPDNKLPDTTH